MLSSPRFRHPPTQRLTQNNSESKNKRPSLADGNATQDSPSDIVPLTSSHGLQSSSCPAGAPQSATLFLQSSRMTEEECQQHISVIHATGLAASSTPVAVVQSHKGASPLPSGSFSNSPLHLTHLSSPKDSSVCSSPKPPALRCPSKPLSLCSPPTLFSLCSPTKPPMLVASHKPQRKPTFLMSSPKSTEFADGVMESRGTPLDGASLCLNTFKLKQVSYVCFPKSCIETAFLKVQNTNIFLILSCYKGVLVFLSTVHQCFCHGMNNNL